MDRKAQFEHVARDPGRDNVRVRRRGVAVGRGLERDGGRQRAAPGVPRHQTYLRRAIWHLYEVAPGFSAYNTFWTRQVAVVALLLAAAAAGLAAAPDAAFSVGLVILAVPFALIVFFRIVATVVVMTRRRACIAGDEPLALPALLPRYTVLVPLYDEARMIPQLLASLAALDYPRERLDIKLLLEEDDTPTREAVAAERLERHICAIIVPASEPRTKPKALNYGLQTATGDFVVVYDAEDLPAPDQLKRAVAMFAAEATARAARQAAGRRPGPALACVQARLFAHNAKDSWLSRGIMAQTPRAQSATGILT